MKTLPLSEVLASATPLPYRVQLEETPVLVGGEDAVCRVYKASDNPLAVANAALLCHAANMLPELEAAFSAIPELLEILADDSEELGLRERPQHARDTAERLRLILSRARSVPMP